MAPGFVASTTLTEFLLLIFFPKNRLPSQAAPPNCPAPPRGNLKARIAQLVEQLAFNQLVLGSSPSPRTSFRAKSYNRIPSNRWFGALNDCGGSTASEI